jgi:uncharacterized protein (UPF0332 family)
MNNSNRLQYSQYRLEKAQESLNSAFTALAYQQASTAVNRAYYCIFHSIRAILAVDGFDSKKHSGVIAYFRRKYIKTKIFDEIYSDMIGSAFNMRNNSDYADFYDATLDDAREQVENAKLFLSAVEAYLQDIWNKQDIPENTE